MNSSGSCWHLLCWGFSCRAIEDIPCSFMLKLPYEIELFTKTCQPVLVPKYSRFLRFSTISAPVDGGEVGVQNWPYGVTGRVRTVIAFWFWGAFGLPWSYKGFIEQACRVGRPALRDSGVPKELRAAEEKHMQWTDEQLVAYRVSWCRKWVVRAKEFEAA